MGDELANFVNKFEQLNNAGMRTFLWMESHAGVALVTLQAHLPGFQEDHRHRRHYQEDSSHHHHFRGDPRHHQEYPRPKRATPSRVRRRVRREQARAQLKKSASPPPPQPDPKPNEEAEKDFPPRPPPQLDAQPKDEAEQALAQPADPQPNEEAEQAPRLPPQPDPQPNEEAEQAPHPPPKLEAQINEEAVQAPYPHPLLEPQPKDGAEQALPPHQLSVVDAAAPPPLGKAVPRSSLPADKVSWPIHYKPEDQSLPHHPLHDGPLLPLDTTAHRAEAADQAALPHSENPPPPESAQPVLLPLQCQNLPQPPLHPADRDKVPIGHPQHLPPPQPVGVDQHQHPPHPIHPKQNIGSFCFNIPEDRPKSPPTSLSGKVRRTCRKLKPRPSDPLPVRMKPTKVPLLNLSIEKGVKNFYSSGVWVGHVCKFVNFVNSEDGLCTEPTLICVDPGPLPPLGPLGSQ